MLYETFGFPLELTKEICEAKGVSVDEEGFNKASEAASDLARSSWKGSGEKNWLESMSVSGQTEFLGYKALEASTTVVACERQGDFWILVLEKTPFYPEGGGQVGDEGAILDEKGAQVLAQVVDTQKQEGVIFHIAKMKTAQPLAPGAKVIARVDAVRRAYIRPHHTATHLLNEALRRLVGTTVRQAGSYVGADKLRFDFTSSKALGREKIAEIEKLVIEEIRKKLPVSTRVESIDKVKDYGAVTLPGENYGTRPRFVLIGEKGWQNPLERFSLELCGGTHVQNTDEIGRFKILRESAVSSGVRRIEAVAGKAVDDYERLKNEEEAESSAKLLIRQRELLAEISSLGGKADESPKEARSEHVLRMREKQLTELLGRLKSQRFEAEAQKGASALEIGPFRLRAQRFEGARADQLRGLADTLKIELSSGIVFAASPSNGKLSFVLSATKDLSARFDAAALAKTFAASRGGSAGGRADFAQGGVPDGNWDELIGALSALLKQALPS
jgi:alanyl-tRNA synthetase